MPTFRDEPARIVAPVEHGIKFDAVDVCLDRPRPRGDTLGLHRAFHLAKVLLVERQQSVEFLKMRVAQLTGVQAFVDRVDRDVADGDMDEVTDHEQTCIGRPEHSKLQADILHRAIDIAAIQLGQGGILQELGDSFKLG